MPIGAIANGHIFAAHGLWVPLNRSSNTTGPWRPGDIVNDCAFTGASWVTLPAGWRTDPTGRHDLRWWNGKTWTEHVMSNGVQFAEPVSAPARPMPSNPSRPHTGQRTGFWSAVQTFGNLVDRFAFSGWVVFWLTLAIWSSWTAWQEDDPRLLGLTATASANVFAYKLTGKSWRTLKKRLAKLPYVVCGLFAAGGVWLSIQFDDPSILKLTMIVTMIGLMASWVIS